MSQETETIRPNTSMKKVSKIWLDSRLEDIERHTEKDVLTIDGGIMRGIDISVRMAIELLNDRRDTLLVILTTKGGYVEEVQNIVQILRHHYKHVHFLVPVYAMSAGTVLALSGDRIYMDYFSTLGPIDPQIYSAGRDQMVPGLSYLYQYKQLIAKGELSPAEYTLLEKLDLAELHSTELAAKLSVSLIKDWLVKYKFKDWEVPPQQKQERAAQIAEALNDHQKWYTHGRGIHKDILERDIGLQIDDYGIDNELKGLVWQYFWDVLEYDVGDLPCFIHSRADLTPYDA